jgi:hypothetical protein
MVQDIVNEEDDISRLFHGLQSVVLKDHYTLQPSSFLTLFVDEFKRYMEYFVGDKDTRLQLVAELQMPCRLGTDALFTLDTAGYNSYMDSDVLWLPSDDKRTIHVDTVERFNQMSSAELVDSLHQYIQQLVQHSARGMRKHQPRGSTPNAERYQFFVERRDWLLALCQSSTCRYMDLRQHIEPVERIQSYFTRILSIFNGEWGGDPTYYEDVELLNEAERKVVEEGLQVDVEGAERRKGEREERNVARQQKVMKEIQTVKEKTNGKKEKHKKTKKDKKNTKGKDKKKRESSSSSSSDADVDSSTSTPRSKRKVKSKTSVYAVDKGVSLLGFQLNEVNEYDGLSDSVALPTPVLPRPVSPIVSPVITSPISKRKSEDLDPVPPRKKPRSVRKSKSKSSKRPSKSEEHGHLVEKIEELIDTHFATRSTETHNDSNPNMSHLQLELKRIIERSVHESDEEYIALLAEVQSSTTIQPVLYRRLKVDDLRKYLVKVWSLAIAHVAYVLDKASHVLDNKRQKAMSTGRQPASADIAHVDKQRAKLEEMKRVRDVECAPYMQEESKSDGDSDSESEE